MSREYIADNGGLYEVLSAEQMLEEDLAAERETRRAQHGYVAPSAAAAFLRLARKASQYPCDGLFRLALAKALEKGLKAGPEVDAPTLAQLRSFTSAMEV
jgi:hypothetical protein